jgi:hypothetical protein
MGMDDTLTLGAARAGPYERNHLIRSVAVRASTRHRVTSQVSRCRYPYCHIGWRISWHRVNMVQWSGEGRRVIGDGAMVERGQVPARELVRLCAEGWRDLAEAVRALTANP